MKKLFPLLSIFLLVGCVPANSPSDSIIDPGEDEEVPSEIKYNDYGAFLGRSDNNVKNFKDYKYVSFEFDDFQKATISDLVASGVECFAYLNIGSLETYRDYYDDFVEYTFLDYEHWEDERWIDVTNTDWQSFVVNTLAKKIKEKGATGVYLDNADVYTVFKENGKNYASAGSAIKNIINGINNLGLKVLMNGGAELIDDFNDNRDNFLSSIWGYHQEEVFSLILDYDNDKFGKQNKDDTNYYQSIAKIMKNKGAEVFLLEYTTDTNLIKTIDDFCSSKMYHYYCSSTVDLK